MQESPSLSNRERDVIQLLLQGKSNKLIASEMKVTERTIEFHLTNIYSKFQVNSRMELVLKLKEDPNWHESGKLGDSTVAGKRDFADDDAGLKLSNWVAMTREVIMRIGKELKMKLSSDPGIDNEASPTTFYGAIRRCFIKYADFTGRASRPEFWWFALFVALCTSAFALINETLGSIFLLAVLLPLLAVGSRRLRDSGKSAWWLLFLLVPVGGIIALGFFWALPSTNAFSENETPQA